MQLFAVLAGVFLCAPFAYAQELKLNPEWAKVVGQCKVKNPKGKVWIFKQWHLSPSAVTTDITASQSLPQAGNQQAIYKQIAAWISLGQLPTVLAEGCEGEINESFKTAYNGWTVQSLGAATSQPNFESIVAHVPMKAEAQFKDKVGTWCGDSDSLIKQHSLIFSDLRGLVGYKTRIEQFKSDPTKAQAYVQSFGKVTKLPPNANAEQALKVIQVQMKEKVKELKKVFGLRNQTFVQAVQKHGGKQTALVIGGLHAEDLKSRLEKAQYDCEVVEPAGYAPDDEKLFTDLEKSI